MIQILKLVSNIENIFIGNYYAHQTFSGIDVIFIDRSFLGGLIPPFFVKHSRKNSAILLSRLESVCGIFSDLHLMFPIFTVFFVFVFVFVFVFSILDHISWTLNL